MKHLTGVLGLLFASLVAFGQEKSQITVKGGTTSSNGVVIITVEEGNKMLELQCNQRAPDCTIPRAGSYVMVRLPKNRGLYDCADVESTSPVGKRKRRLANTV
jgi:hypothetical protein